MDKDDVFPRILKVGAHSSKHIFLELEVEARALETGRCRCDRLGSLSMLVRSKSFAPYRIKYPSNIPKVVTHAPV